jgi:hypothetical protein
VRKIWPQGQEYHKDIVHPVRVNQPGHTDVSFTKYG